MRSAKGWPWNGDVFPVHGPPRVRRPRLAPLAVRRPGGRARCPGYRMDPARLAGHLLRIGFAASTAPRQRLGAPGQGARRLEVRGLRAGLRP